MYALLVAVIVTLVAVAKANDDDNRPAVTLELINAVNNAGSTWKAAIPARFQNQTIAQVKRMMGTWMPGHPMYKEPELVKSTVEVGATFPTDFDVRTGFPQCAGIVGHVRDQSSCGSCWAFGSTEAFNDRYCIAHGDAKTLFAPEDTVSCCTGFQCSLSMGCNGGQPGGAWNWFTKTGVSTGGDYADMGTGTTCKPYSLMSCAHHVAAVPPMVGCDTLPEYSTPKCTSTCNEKTYGVEYSKDKHFAKSSYSVKGEDAMKQELMTKGTLSVAFTVYEDFEAYSSGVYRHVSGKSLGGHAVKMVGWGVDNGTPYWTCINSWNPSWGEGGAFRILRGKNECGIEGSVVAGDV